MKLSNFIEWRKQFSPKLRRTAPVGIIHSGGQRTIYGCLCGAQHTCATSYRKARHVKEFVSQHNQSCWPKEITD